MVKCNTGGSPTKPLSSQLESRDDVRPTKQHKDSFMPLCHTLPHSALHMHRAFCEIIFQGKYLAAQKLLQYVSSRSKSFLEQPSKTAGGGTLSCNQVSNRGQGCVLMSLRLQKRQTELVLLYRAAACADISSSSVNIVFWKLILFCAMNTHKSNLMCFNP